MGSLRQRLQNNSVCLCWPSAARTRVEQRVGGRGGGEPHAVSASTCGRLPAAPPHVPLFPQSTPSFTSLYIHLLRLQADVAADGREQRRQKGVQPAHAGAQQPAVRGAALPRNPLRPCGALEACLPAARTTVLLGCQQAISTTVPASQTRQSQPTLTVSGPSQRCASAPPPSRPVRYWACSSAQPELCYAATTAGLDRTADKGLAWSFVDHASLAADSRGTFLDSTVSPAGEGEQHQSNMGRLQSITECAPLCCPVAWPVACRCRVTSPIPRPSHRLSVAVVWHATPAGWPDYGGGVGWWGWWCGGRCGVTCLPAACCLAEPCAYGRPVFPVDF